MKILSIYRYYWPDITPYARILRSILERLAEDGHRPTILTGQPAYNDVQHDRQPWRETLGGVDVRRVRLLPERKWMGPLRALNFVLFLGRGVWHALFNRYDVILASSNPPVISGLALRLIRWLTGAQYVYHCQDLHPECAVLAEKLTAGPVERLLRRIDGQNCSAAARTVVLSEDMVQALRDRGLSDSNVGIINNFALEVPDPSFDRLPEPFGNVPDSGADSGAVSEDRLFRVFFAGNMGSFQGLDKIIEAAKRLQGEPQIQFVFMGAGEQRANLERQAAGLVGSTVRFLSFHPVEEAFGCMHRADLGIVSLIPGVYKVAYPSKTMMYLAAGCPVLAVIESESVLAKQLQDNGLGWVPRDTTPQGIADAIRTAYNDRQQNGIDRKRIQSGGGNLFDREIILDKWAAMFAEISSDIGLARVVVTGDTKTENEPASTRRAA